MMWMGRGALILMVVASCGGSVTPPAAQPVRPAPATSPGPATSKTADAAPPARKLTPLEEAAHENDLGKEALFAGKNDEAITHFEQAYRLDPLDLRFTVNLGLAYMSANRHADAVAFARRLMVMPGATRRMLLIGAVLSGDALAECISRKQFDCGRDKYLMNAEVERLDQQGQQLVSAGRADDALPIFLRAYAYSGDPRPLLRIATFEYVTGYYMDARGHAKHVKELIGKQPSKLAKETDDLLAAIEAACKTDPRACTI